MLPNFLIIGTQKGATSWLARSLEQHPDVFMASSLSEKEIHFFDSYFHKGLAWYETYFDDWSGQSAVGEATPNYMVSPKVPARIQETLGDEIKLITCLRHPVDRAYSAFWMFLRLGSIPVSADFCTSFRKDACGIQQQGFYFRHLSRYLDLFPRENLLALVYEELKQDNLKAFRTCTEFLNVDLQFVPGFINAKSNKATDIIMFTGQYWQLRRTMRALTRKSRTLKAIGDYVFKKLPRQREYAPLAEDLRQELLSGFMTDIEQLEDLLGIDLSIWFAPS
jgi:hypothetical protein